jgi:hypothetical protein
MCFLCGPCRRVVKDNKGRLQSVVAEKPRVEDKKPSWKGDVRISQQQELLNQPATVEEKTLVVQEGNGRRLRQSPVVSCYK